MVVLLKLPWVLHSRPNMVASVIEGHPDQPSMIPMGLKYYPSLRNHMSEEWTPTEDDDNSEVVYLEHLTLADGRTMVLPIEDTIVTITHPLLGRTLTGPSAWVGTVFARWDLIVGHLKMKDEVEAEMLRFQDDLEDDN